MLIVDDHAVICKMLHALFLAHDMDVYEAEMEPMTFKKLKN